MKRIRKITLFDFVTTFIFIFLCFITLYPFIYAFSYSVSDTMQAAKRSIVFLPRGLTFDNYRIIFSDSRMLRGLFITVSRTVVGTAVPLIVTGLAAYSMSKPRLKGRKIIFIFFVIPMYVSGGLLPTYVLIHSLGLFNNFWVYILPSAFSTFNMFLMKVYMETIPSSLEEAAMLDGAGELRIATLVFLPLCLPVFATVGLFNAVAQWNSWFDALLYVTKDHMRPLQMILQLILRETQIENILQIHSLTQRQSRRINPESYKMAVLIVTTVPIVFVYPFAQKYFVKGIMMGSVKL